jgi:hypothetical protein
MNLKKLQKRKEKKRREEKNRKIVCVYFMSMYES